MTSIRFRLFLIYTLLLSMTAGFGFFSFQSYQKYAHLTQQLTTSYEVVDLVDSSKSKGFKKSTFDKLQNYRKSLAPKKRAMLVSDYIQAYSSRDYALMAKRASFLKKSERAYRQSVAPKIRYHNQRVWYFGVISLTGTLISLLIVWVYSQNAIFQPMSQLSRRMVDFLNQKYTYQFTVPENNEIGRLQGTFNSLAQTVLVNMDELKALDKAKSEFLSIASHELRTPLTSIKGSLSLLKSGVGGDLNDVTKNLVTIAETETNRLIRLINDILDLAKIEARKFPLKKDWGSFADLVEKTFQSLQGLCEANQIKLQHNGCENIAILYDEDRIQQVLTNLLSNAIKYSPESGTVFLNCEIDSNEQLKISITDQGKGIAPEDQELIFEQFRQATSPDKPLVKGTGLGLAIAKALVEEHGGYIGVSSIVNEGCTFFFSLPDWKLSQNSQPNTELAA